MKPERLERGGPLLTVETRETREGWSLLTIEIRENRDKWPLLTVEPERLEWGGPC